MASSHDHLFRVMLTRCKGTLGDTSHHMCSSSRMPLLTRVALLSITTWDQVRSITTWDHFRSITTWGHFHSSTTWGHFHSSTTWGHLLPINLKTSYNSNISTVVICLSYYCYTRHICNSSAAYL